MLAHARGVITLFLLDARNAREAEKCAEAFAALSWCLAGDADAACLGLWVVQGLFKCVDGADAGIDIGKFGQPFVARFRFEDVAQQFDGLLALSRPDGYVKWEQFEMPDARAEGVPEFIFKRGQRDVFAVLRLVDIVAGQAAIEGGMAGDGRFSGI